MTPGLERQLIRSILLLAAAGVLVVGFCTSILSASLFFERMKEGARASVIHAAEIGALSVDEFLRRSTDIVWQITSRSRARTLLEQLNAGEIELQDYRSQTQAILNDALVRSEQLQGIVRLDISQKSVARVGEGIATELLPIRTDALDQPGISGPFDVNGETRMIVHAPIFDRQGGRIGTDVALFSLNELARLLRAKNDASRFDWDMEIFLAVGHGQKAVFYEPFDLDRRPMRPTLIDGFGSTEPDQDLLAKLEDQALGVGNHFFAAREIEAGWHVVVRKSTDALYGGVHRDIAISFAGLIILTAIGATAFMLIIRRYTSRLNHAVGGMRTNIESNEARFEDLIEGSAQGIMIHRDYRPLLVNDAWAKAHGYTVDEVMALDNIRDFFSADDKERVEEYRVARLCGEDAPEQYEYQAVHRDGSTFWVEIFVRQICWKGEPAILATIGDISERKRQEALDAYYRSELEDLVKIRTAEIEEKSKGLEVALQKEREYNAFMEQFVAMASHEFRTPLTIIDSVSQRLFRRADRLTPQDVKHGALKARGAVQRMINLIEGLLHSARMDAGKLILKPQTFDLAEVISRTCSHEREISPRHSISAELDDLPDRFFGDPTMLEQVFSNLLSNAAKYSPENPIISVKGMSRDEAVSITVADNGVGIPADEIPKLFDRFFRASTSSGIAGTGIGLNLVSQIIDLHGGSIQVDSIEGQGSTFIVNLPLRQAADYPEMSDTPYTGSPTPSAIQPTINAA